MNNANYNKEFAFARNIIQELIKLSEKGLYSINELSKLGFKQTQINQLAIANTVNLLIDSEVISIKDSKCRAKLYSEEKIKELILSQLKKDNIFEVIEEEVEKDSEGQLFINSINLIEKYRGVLPLVQYLGLAKYNNNKRIFYLSESGKKTCSRKIKTLKELEKDLVAKKERGAEAEKYVLLLEKNRLKNHPNFSEIRQISDDNVGAGYDIESFQSMDSVKLDKFIEVKSYKETKTFYWSVNEIKVARNLADKYTIVVVNYNKINEEVYQPKEISNPYIFFNMKEVLKGSSRLSDSDDLPQIQGESYSIHSKHLW